MDNLSNKMLFNTKFEDITLLLVQGTYFSTYNGWKICQTVNAMCLQLINKADLNLFLCVCDKEYKQKLGKITYR